MASSNCKAVSPSDCQTGRSDNTCAGSVIVAPPFPGGTPVSSPPPIPIAGIANVGYWYFGYDFQTPDSGQLPLPFFINRSGKEIRLDFSFEIPLGICGRDCLPGIEFYKGSTHIYKIDPELKITGNKVSASLDILNGESYSWVIGLWASHDPRLAVTDTQGNSVPPEVVGLSARPDLAYRVLGSTIHCLCDNGTQALCSFGDHFSNGLLGVWSKNVGVTRQDSWTQCQHEGG
jgi:hypothetical protein